MLFQYISGKFLNMLSVSYEYNYNFVCYLIETKCNYYQDMCITEKYRPEPGLEPRVSRLTYECSTTELSKPIQI